MNTFKILCVLMVTLLPYSIVNASGSNVAQITYPYVQQLEQELEYEVVLQSDSRPSLDEQQQHKLAYGRALSDRWLIEFGATGVNTPNQDFDIASYELEVKVQLSEQGEFNNDWAIEFELERETDQDIWEIGSTLIVLHEWKRWIGTANLSLVYETGDAVDSEVESAFAGQLKYRYKATFEPGIEFFKNEDTNAIGPSVVGQIRLGGRKKIYWGAGIAYSLDSSLADTSYRANIEFEF